jgi:aryl-phospho-beta-D-glucosidase BglC (GH1 family)
MSFCTALGPVEANRQLRRHWKTWITEQQIVDLKALGADTVRIPVGDWMYVPVRYKDLCLIAHYFICNSLYCILILIMILLVWSLHRVLRWRTG